MDNYYKVPLDEKETIICINYLKKIVNIYTTRVSTMNRASKAIGEPKLIEMTNGKISSMEWDIEFDNRNDIRKILSLSIILPFKKSHKL